MLRIMQVFDFIKYNYLYVVSFFSNIASKIGRGLEYFFHGFNSPDWDYSYFFNDMHFKLKRIEKEIETSKVSSIEEIHLVALKEAISILDRLKDDDYEWKYIQIDEIKNGSLHMLSRESNEFSTRVEIVRYKDLAENKKRKSVNSNTHKSAKEDKDTDLHNLFTIFKKHSEYWWD